MALATNICPHGTDRYQSACGRCESEYRAFEAAETAYKSVSHELNGGGEPRIVAAVLRGEHPYLLQKLNSAIAMAVIGRTYDRLCESTHFGTHPEHDGRLGCNDVVGALRALGVVADDDVLANAAYWRDRIYQTPW